MTFKKNIYPFYHTISDKRLPYINNLYPLKSVNQFQRELDFFQKNYQNISMNELISLYKEHQSIPQNNYFHLTFDDGLKESISIISPILKERNLDATFFINPNFIANQEIFYRYKVGLLLKIITNKNQRKDLLNYSIHDVETINQLIIYHKINLDEYDIYLNETDISDLINNDFTIGAHSMNHPYFRDISFEEQLKETNESLDYLQEKFNLNYRIFSFPYTDDGVKKLFFESISTDLTFGTAGIKDDEITSNIHRLPMDNNLGNPNYFVLKNLVTFTLKKIFNANIVKHE